MGLAKVLADSLLQRLQPALNPLVTQNETFVYSHKPYIYGLSNFVNMSNVKNVIR